MLVIKAPLRISLFGGGTDIPEYFTQYGSTIISFALTRSIYLIHNRRPTGGYRLSYGKVEELSDLLQAEHTLIRAAERMYGIGPPCTLSIVSDVPKGTGLGSSSALAVALAQLTRADFEPLELLDQAYDLERQVSPVGIQDFLPAIYGGFKVYEIDRQGHVEVAPAPLYLAQIIREFGLLLYTGESRDANNILSGMRQSMNELARIHSIARLAKDKLDAFNHITLAEALTVSWRFKRDIPGVATARLNDQFAAALRAGAHGGKLCGAGGGGCWFFIVSPGDRRRVKEATGLTEIPFGIGEEIEEFSL